MTVLSTLVALHCSRPPAARRNPHTFSVFVSRKCPRSSCHFGVTTLIASKRETAHAVRPVAGQPSGVSISCLSRTARSSGSRVSHASSISPAPSRSRKCVRSLSRNDVSFIRTSDSSATKRKSLVRSQGSRSGAACGSDARTFSSANKTWTASPALLDAPSRNISIPAECRYIKPPASKADFARSKSARRINRSTSRVNRTRLSSTRVIHAATACPPITAYGMPLCSSRAVARSSLSRTFSTARSILSSEKSPSLMFAIS